MRRLTIALVVGFMILAPGGAQAAGRAGFEIDKCQTIDKPGSYKLVNDLTFTNIFGTCLLITSNFVTIDLAGFAITGPPGLSGSKAIEAQASSPGLIGIAVRDGLISGFSSGVELLSADGSVVEGLRVYGFRGSSFLGIGANGIVKDNTVVGFFGNDGTGISATGLVTGNFVSNSDFAGLDIGPGSVVTGNVATNSSPFFGIRVTCPSNVMDNTAINNVGKNIQLDGDGCIDTNNVSP